MTICLRLLAVYLAIGAIGGANAGEFALNKPDDVPMKLQERAYTSPIWYTP